jgi:hypothetical protein
MSSSDSEQFSPRLLARLVGILGLIGIVTGAFDIGYVQNTLIVAGNPSATLHNILAHETLFRWGFASHLFELSLNIPGEIIGFYLFRRVNVIVAAIALCCRTVGIAIEAVDLLAAYVPLKLAIEGAPWAHSVPNNCMPCPTSQRSCSRRVFSSRRYFMGSMNLRPGFCYSDPASCLVSSESC